MSNKQNASPHEAETNEKGKRKSGATSTPPPEAEFLKIDEVAVILNVARRTVDNMIRAKELESYRFRGNRRIARKDLDAYMERARNDDRPTLGERHQEVARRPRRGRTTSNA